MIAIYSDLCYNLSNTNMSAVSQTFRRFAHHHDEMPAFHAGYLVITFLLAALFNIGAFGLLIVAHMSLDYVKYSEVHGFGWKKTMKGMFFESLVDLMLFAIALVFGVYFHHMTGVIAISGLLRAEETIVSALGILIPKLEILHHMYVDFFNVKRHMASLPPELTKGWSLVDILCISLMIVALTLVLVAPRLLALDSNMYLRILGDQLIPWNL